MPRYRLHDTLTFVLADGGELVVEHGSTVFFDGTDTDGMTRLQGDHPRSYNHAVRPQGAAEAVGPVGRGRAGTPAHVRTVEDRSGIRAPQAADNPDPEMTTERRGLAASMQTQRCLGQDEGIPSAGKPMRRLWLIFF
jgi:hypothetical protein